MGSACGTALADQSGVWWRLSGVGGDRSGLSGQTEFRRLLDKIPAGAYTCDRDGLITYFNQPAVDLWGRAPKLNDPADRFCGSFRLFSTDGSPVPHDRCCMAQALKTEMEFNGHEIVIERPDGERRAVLTHANPIRGGSGKVLGGVNVLVDITTSKRAEDALKRADRARNEFLAILAHELRNPLAPIQNAVEILHLEGGLGPQSQWALAAVDRQMRQMTRLIEDLVDVARISSNRLELRRETIELSTALRAAVETSGALLQAGGQEFVVTLPAEPIYLDADPTRLTQAFSNLLNNATKYTPRGGRIWLTGERRDGAALITVRDTGAGISPEMLSSIFDMFTQGEQSQVRTLGGLGIGLTLVKRLVELHGGLVTAHSGGLGQGSSFEIHLPVIGQPSGAPHPGREPARGLASALRILVVDDNRDTADSLAMLLRSSGSEVRTAYDGLEALEVANIFRPDVGLLDIGLPKADGHEVARRLRMEPWGKRMRLIAITGWSSETDRARSADAGFDHHLVKPLDPALLAELLGAPDLSRA
jgi:signal transduction histidine kinase/CheY-like chemotaxis protein